MSKILPTHKKGISLIELLITLMVLSIAIIPMLGFFSQALKSISEAEVTTMLAFTADMVIQSVLSADDFYDLPNGTVYTRTRVENNSSRVWYNVVYSLSLTSINPDYGDTNADLASSGAQISVPSGLTSQQVNSNYKLVYVKAEYMPRGWNYSTPALKTIELRTIITQASLNH